MRWCRVKRRTVFLCDIMQGGVSPLNHIPGILDIRGADREKLYEEMMIWQVE